MTLKRVLPLVLALMLRAVPAIADVTAGLDVLKDVKAQIEEAYYTDNKDLLLAQLPRLSPLTEQRPSKWHAHYYLAFCHNHLARFYLRIQDEKAATSHMEEAFSQVGLAAKINDSAELYVLRISAMGKKIQLGSSFLRMTRGLETLRFMDKAKKLSPDTPGVVFEDAMTTYHIPGEFGGGLDKARTLLLKNLRILETYEHDDPLYIDWHTQADTLAWLASFEIEEGNLEKAAQYMEQVRTLRPQHAFLSQVVEVLFKSKQEETLRTSQKKQEGEHG